MAKLFFISLLLFAQFFGMAQSVGIGTTSPDTSALIEMKSTSKGILIPRITEAARLQIANPAPGMLVFQSNNTSFSLKGFYYFEGSDDQWYRMGTSNQIGIGTEIPHPKAILDMKSTSQGVLFPTLTTLQRNAINNPPNGLHIFNADERCLNYYDAVNQIWNCYCSECKTVVINITTSQTAINFYELVKDNPSPKYVVNINAGVIISASTPGGDAFLFNTMTFPSAITIINNGTIAGAGGSGGRGNIDGYFTAGVTCIGNLATNGQGGGSAIATKTGVTIVVKNYGIIAGGGGGGNSGSNGASGYAGGGGGGAGSMVGNGGNGAGYYTGSILGGCSLNILGVNGIDGTTVSGGNGGAGASGGTAGTAGGARGAAGVGGGAAAGKAIKGGSGNTITNFGGGQFFGAVD